MFLEDHRKQLWQRKNLFITVGRLENRFAFTGVNTEGLPQDIKPHEQEDQKASLPKKKKKKLFWISNGQMTQRSTCSRIMGRGVLGRNKTAHDLRHTISPHVVDVSIITASGTCSLLFTDDATADKTAGGRLQ